MNLVQEQVIALRQSSLLSVLHAHQTRPALSEEIASHSGAMAFELEQLWKNEVNREIVARGVRRLPENTALAKLREASKKRVAV